MVYSLINVGAYKNGLVCGNWLQDCHGTLADAISAARRTEKANSGMISVAVVEKVGGSTPAFAYFEGLQRLDALDIP